MRRCGRGGERGAETLEFIGVLPLLILTALVVWQGVVLVRQQAEADADARTLARQAVICDPGATLTLSQVDPAATAGVMTVDASSARPYVVVSVSLPAQAVLPALDLARLGVAAPHAVVAMRHEPC